MYRNFSGQVTEFANYVKALNKNLAGTIMAYHPNGHSEYESNALYATATALKSWEPNGGIKFTFIAAGDDAFSVEIPEINTIYRHMMGSTCHNILTSAAHIDAEIATLKEYQAKNYVLVLTSHFVPEGQAAVAQKIAYLENVKVIASTSTTKESFMEAVKSAYPTYSGENYLEMTAGFLFK